MFGFAVDSLLFIILIHTDAYCIIIIIVALNGLGPYNVLIHKVIVYTFSKMYDGDLYQNINHIAYNFGLSASKSQDNEQKGEYIGNNAFYANAGININDRIIMIITICCHL